MEERDGIVVLTATRITIAGTCALGAAVLLWLTVVGLSGSRSVGWGVVVISILYGLPGGIAAASAVGILTRHRWGLVAARIFAAIVASFTAIIAFVMLAVVAVALLTGSADGGDAAPPAWFVGLLGLIPAAVAAMGYGLLRAATAELDKERRMGAGDGILATERGADDRVQE